MIYEDILIHFYSRMTRDGFDSSSTLYDWVLEKLIWLYFVLYRNQ